MIPVTYSIGPSSGMILMAGVYYGAIFGGSTSSILINARAWQERLRRHSMVIRWRKRHGGKALAIAAYASFLAALSAPLC